jgi:hypothetical protein
MSKSDLTRLSLELDKVFQEIREISKDNKDVVILVDGWKESLGMNLDLFEEKLTLFRTRLNKYISVYPAGKRGRRKKDVTT